MSDWVKLVIDIGVDVLGIAGTVLLVVPVLRDLSNREILGLLRPERKPAAFAQAGDLAAGITEKEMRMFRPNDRRCVVGGLAAIAASYLVHMVGAIVYQTTH